MSRYFWPGTIVLLAILGTVALSLAIVHALTWLSKQDRKMPVYSDSQTAIAWVNTGEAKTKLDHDAISAPLFALIHSAENWLAENKLEDDAVQKWDTDMWGEIPADFGRK